MTPSEMEELGAAEIRNRLARGDYPSPLLRAEVCTWLKIKDDQQKFDKACEQATKSAHLDANRQGLITHRIAVIAVTMAAISNVIAVIALFR